MDLIDLIESHRFMGTEFLMWLWTRSDIFEGRFMIGERACEVWFDDKITLEAVMVETEQSVLKGASPTFTPEAREALRQGKLPTQARLRIIHDGKEFQFTLKGGELAMTGIKLPALMTRSDDEKFYERMYLLELLEEILEDLYGEFLGLRLSTEVWPKMLTVIREWVQSETLISTDAYRALSARAPALARTRVPTPSAKASADAAEGATGSSPETDEAAASSDDADEAPPVIPPPADDVRPEASL